MKFEEFASRFTDVHQDEFRVRFPHPFLLEDTAFLERESERRLYLVRGTKGKPLVIGRGARCHIPIKDKLVSTKHAELTPPAADDGAWVLIDLSSTNKTFISGKELEPGQPCELTDGLPIGFGPGARFLFLESVSFYKQLQAQAVSARARSNSFDADTATDILQVGTIRHGLLSSGDKASKGGPAAAQRPPSRATRAGEELLIFCDTLDPIPLDVGQRIVCGRKPEKADYVLPHKHISRRHLEFQRSPKGVFVRDLGSANGTNLDGHGLLDQEWTTLPIGARVMAGPFILTVGGPQVHGTDPGPGGTIAISGRRASEGIEGQLADLPLQKLLQEIEQRGDSGALEINGATMIGRLTFRNGNPYTAETADGLKGPQAVHRLLDETRGTYVLLPDAKTGDREISVSFSDILVDGFLEHS